jgi:AbiV family abortive infection protein
MFKVRVRVSGAVPLVPPVADPLLEAYEVVLRARRDPVLEEFGGRLGPIPPGPLMSPDDKLLARACLVNSLALYRSGVQLAACEEFGHAVALTVLAIEECAKALMLRFLSLGVFSKDPRDRGKRPYVEERLLWCHECKHTIVFFQLVGGGILALPEFEQATVERAKGLTDKELLANPELLARLVVVPTSEQVESIKRALDTTPEFRDRMIALISDFGTLNSAKLRGFYVDRAGEEGHTPGEFTAADYARIAARAREVIEPNIVLTGGEPPSEIAQVLDVGLRSVKLPPIVLECPHRDRAGPARARAGRG